MPNPALQKLYLGFITVLPTDILMLVRNGLQKGEHYNSDNMFVPLSFFAQKDLLQLSKTFLLKKSYFIATPTNPPHSLVFILP